jgi:hypothetical protein
LAGGRVGCANHADLGNYDLTIVDESGRVWKASPYDCGSYIDPMTCKRIALDMKVTMEKCEKSLSDRKEHNEWIVEDYEVKGIMMLPDRLVWHRWQESYGMEGAERLISPAEVSQLFSGQRLFSIDSSNYLARDEHAQWHHSSHREIYGW